MDLRLPSSSTNEGDNGSTKNKNISTKESNHNGQAWSWNQQHNSDTSNASTTKAALDAAHNEPSSTSLEPEGELIYGQNPQPIIPAIPANSSQLLQLQRKKAAFKLTTTTPLAPAGSRAELSAVSESITSSTEEMMLVDEVDDNTLGFLPFQPPTTTSHPAAGFESITKKLTQYLLQTYVTCNPNYSYQPINNPRRVLTKPSKHAGNDGYDNEDCDYILYVNDILGSTEGHQYQIIDALGSGTFGQVVKCQNIKTKEHVALKVIKNKPAYYNQSLIEVAILDMIKKQYDIHGKHHLVRMKDSFVFRNHLCIAFEILSVNLYELIKQNQFRGLSTNLIRVFVTQILDALTVLFKAKIIHCDLKPENILLKSLESPSIKVIDLGSACHENQTVYTYIQSRFYRSPEVLLGLPYTSSIDVWSLGCIAAELFLGLPLFPGSSEYNQISRIVEILGNPPNHMCDKGKNGAQYFIKSAANGKFVFTLKSMEQYMREYGTKEQPSKRYFQGHSLPDIINAYPIMRRGLSNREIDIEMQNRRSFIDFLSGMLRLNPLERWTPQQALQHPFITQKPFLEPFMPMRAKVATPVAVAPSVTAVTSSIDTRSGTHVNSQQAHAGAYQTGTSYQGPVADPTIIDSRYSQIVGTFSEFQINPNHRQQQQQHVQMHPGSVPEQAMMQAQLHQQQIMQQQRQQQQPHPSSSFIGVSGFQSQSVGSPHQGGFNLRKSKSQFSVANSGASAGGAMNHNNLMSHYNSTPGLYQQFHSDMASAEKSGLGGGPYTEGHPRYGDQGERLRIPSRLPSAAASVDWEIFEGGASVPNSYASSRHGSSSSFAEVHHQMQQSDGSGGGRRPSLTHSSFASPNSARHLPFQARKMGSSSNDSFITDPSNSNNYMMGRVSESNLRMDNGSFSGMMQRTSANSSTHSLNGTSSKTHKKVKSSSSSLAPQSESSTGAYGRRPSVPSNFYPQQQMRQPSYENFQFSIPPNQQQQQAPPSQLNGTLHNSASNPNPYQGSDPIKMPPKKE